MIITTRYLIESRANVSLAFGQFSSNTIQETRTREGKRCRAQIAKEKRDFSSLDTLTHRGENNFMVRNVFEILERRLPAETAFGEGARKEFVHLQNFSALSSTYNYNIDSEKNVTTFYRSTLLHREFVENFRIIRNVADLETNSQSRICSFEIF